MSRKSEIVELKGRIKKLEAQAKYLNAPYAIWNDVEECWMFFPVKPLKKKNIGTAFYGDGYILLEEKAI